MNTIRIHDLSTNEIIDRDMSPEEIKVAAKLSAQSLDAFAEGTKKAANKAALLERLGITAEEAHLLLA